jgi:hypothetical protein
MASRRRIRIQARKSISGPNPLAINGTSATLSDPPTIISRGSDRNLNPELSSSSEAESIPEDDDFDDGDDGSLNMLDGEVDEEL